MESMLLFVIMIVLLSERKFNGENKMYVIFWVIDFDFVTDDFCCSLFLLCSLLTMRSHYTEHFIYSYLLLTSLVILTEGLRKFKFSVAHLSTI